MSQKVAQPLTRETITKIIEEYWRIQLRVAKENQPPQRRREAFKIIHSTRIKPENIKGAQKTLIKAYGEHIDKVANIYYTQDHRHNSKTLIKLKPTFPAHDTYGELMDIAPMCSLQILSDRIYFILGHLQSCKITYIKTSETRYIELPNKPLSILGVHAYFATTLNTIHIFHNALVTFFQRILPYNPGSIELTGYNTVQKQCENILSQKDPRLMKRHILLTGPPGCGKSMIMKQLAQDHPEYIRCSLTRTDGWLSWLKLFSHVLKHSDKRMMVLVDEIDELGLSREKNGEQVYTLLRILDGMDDTCGLVIIATTNRLQDLDEALLRPGRFGPVISVQKPDETQRIKILQYYGERYDASLDPTLVYKDIHTPVTGADIRVAVEDCLVQGKPVSNMNVANNLRNLVNAYDQEPREMQCNHG